MKSHCVRVLARFAGKLSILLFVLLVLLVSVSSAFGAGGGETETPSLDTPQTVTIWCTWSAVYNEIFADLAAAYAEKNPLVTLEYQQFAGAAWAERTALAKQSNDLPTMALITAISATDEVHQGTLVPVTDVIEPFKSALNPYALESATFGADDYYMVPLFESPYILLYNADIMKAAGLESMLPANPDAIAQWTVRDFEDVILPTLTKHFGDSGRYTIGLSAADTQSILNFQLWLRMYGGSLFRDGEAVTDENVLRAMEKLKEWSDKGYANFDIVTKGYRDLRADFQHQNAVMFASQTMSGASFVDAMQKGTIETFDLRYATVPRQMGRENSQSAAYLYNGAFLFNNRGRQLETEAGKEFLRWYIAQDDLLKRFSVLNARPSSLTAASALAEEAPKFAEWTNIDSHYFDYTGGIAGYGETRFFAASMLQSFFSGARTSAGAYEEFMKAANEIIQEYNARSVILNK